MNQKNKKVVAVVITAVAISGSATAMASASPSKAKSVRTKTTVTTVNRTFNINGMGNMHGMRGDRGMGHHDGAPFILADLVTKGTITADESKLIADTWRALEVAKRASATPPAPRTPGVMDSELKQALADLVKAGKLSQTKADAVAAAVNAAEAARAANPPAFGRGEHPFGDHDGDSRFGGRGHHEHGMPNTTPPTATTSSAN